MGSFSYICKKSKKAVRNGEAVYLFLLKDGKVIEEQYGNYGYYGNVEGQDWQMDWNDICHLNWSANKGDGIAAVRAEVFKGEKDIPTTQSQEDPRQGCGTRKVMKAETSYHKVYDIEPGISN